MQEKTAVFSFGSLSGAEEPRSYDIDEPTRELPLIAGRFAGREWVPGEMLRERPEKTSLNGAAMRRRNAFALSVGALAAMLLLVISLLGQARLVDMNEEANALSARADALRQEQNVLVVQYELSRAESFYTAAGYEQTPAVVTFSEEPLGEGRATVLSVRRGREIHHFWRSLVDRLGVSFH